MKKSVIKQIFNGERGCAENMRVLPEYHNSSARLDKIDKLYKEFIQSLSKQSFALFEKYYRELDEKISDEVDFYYVEGFKLGLLVGVECMND